MGWVDETGRSTALRGLFVVVSLIGPGHGLIESFLSFGALSPVSRL